MARKLVSSSGYTSAPFQSVAVQPGSAPRRFREPMHRAGSQCAQVLRLLLIEDNCQDSFSLKASLKESGLKFLARRVQCRLERLPTLIKRATECFAEKRAKEAAERNEKQALDLLRQMSENVSDFLFICSLDHKKQYCAV